MELINRIKALSWPQTAIYPTRDYVPLVKETLYLRFDNFKYYLHVICKYILYTVKYNEEVMNYGKYILFIYSIEHTKYPCCVKYIKYIKYCFIYCKDANLFSLLYCGNYVTNYKNPQYLIHVVNRKSLDESCSYSKFRYLIPDTLWTNTTIKLSNF